MFEISLNSLIFLSFAISAGFSKLLPRTFSGYPYTDVRNFTELSLMFVDILRFLLDVRDLFRDLLAVILTCDDILTTF